MSLHGQKSSFFFLSDLCLFRYFIFQSIRFKCLTGALLQKKVNCHTFFNMESISGVNILD